MTTEYARCNCDKYNPECRCYPREQTTTNDLRETVARAIAAPMAEALGVPVDDVIRVFQETVESEADAAIAAATPIIRARVIGELAEKAHDHALGIVHRESDASTDWLEVPNWLRAQLEATR